jgi:hypothetical protein
MKPSELMRHGEEPNELGGYFIVNGLEKLIRMIVGTRRNTVERATGVVLLFFVVYSVFLRGFFVVIADFHVNSTEFHEPWHGLHEIRDADSLRARRSDVANSHVSGCFALQMFFNDCWFFLPHTRRYHFMSDGNVKVRVLLRKSEQFINVVLLLKCLIDCTDRGIFEAVMQVRSGCCVASSLNGVVAVNRTIPMSSLPITSSRQSPSVSVNSEQAYAKTNDNNESKRKEFLIAVFVDRPATRNRCLVIAFVENVAVVDLGCVALGIFGCEIAGAATMSAVDERHRYWQT